MKRNYQGYSGSGPNNPNPQPSIAYPPLPSGPPPPQPAPSATPQASQINQQYQQPSSSSIQQPPSSQPYQYNPQQFPAASATSYGQYPGYPAQQQAAAYPGTLSGASAPGTAPYGYSPQLPQNPQQQQQAQQPQSQQQQHPAYANYGYGAPAGPQQPPKVAQSYQPYSHGSNPNQLPANPTNQYSNPNIPPNPYTAYTPAQVSPPTLQSSPGSAAPPPYKRPRYEHTPGGGAYGPPTPQQAPYPSATPLPTHQPPPPALPPLRNNNPLNATSSGSIRIGSNSNNSRGPFAPASRAPRPAQAPFGNNSPIRLNLASYDPSAPANYDSAHQHTAQPMAHPLPPHHQSPHTTSAGGHYPQNPSSFPSAPNNMSPANPADHHYPSHPPAHHNPPYPSANELSNPPLNNHQRGPNDGAMRATNFGHTDYGPGSGGPSSGYGSGPPPNHNEHYGFHDDSRPGGHMGGGTRSGRGGFRGGPAPGGRMSRDRGSDYGGEGLNVRGGRGFGGHPYGGSGRGSGSRGRGGSGGSNTRYDDHSSNFSTGGSSRHTERPTGAAGRGSRNGANLPLLTPGIHKAGHHHDRRGGPGGSARYSSLTGAMGSSRGGRRINGRESKFDEHKNPHRPGRGGGGVGSSIGVAGERGEKGRHGIGPGGNRVKNGWGSGFKEFNERELKEKDKGDEAPTKRTLTDFRINALEIADISWQWIADSPDGVGDVGSTVLGTSLLTDEPSKVAVRPTAEPLANRTGKHGRDEDEGRAEAAGDGVGTVAGSAAETSGSVAGSVAGTKKVKSDATVELAKKIDEEAASAVKGLNLTVDDQSSEHEESKVDDEVKNQLLSAQPAPGGAPQADSAPDGGVHADTEPVLAGEEEGAETIAKVDETPVAQEAAKENAPSSTSATPRAATVAPEAPAAARDRLPVAYTKPAIPAGRENSRLRLYFSSPTTDPVVIVNPPGLPTKPLTGATGAKRKLSVSGHSAMSVDTRIGGGRCSSPVSTICPVKGLVVSKNTVKSLKPNAVDGRKGGANEAASKEQAKVVEQAGTETTAAAATTVTAAGTAAGTEGEGQQIAGKGKEKAAEEDKGTVQTDVKTVQEDISLMAKTTGEDGGGGGGPEDGKPTEGYDEDADADGDYEEESNSGLSSDEEAPVPEPQADRLSISYARNTRRIVIDADVVESLRVFRAEHKVEVLVNLLPAVVQGGKYDGEVDEYRVCKGVLVEALDHEIDDYVIIERASLEAAWKMEEKAKGKARAGGGESESEGLVGKANGHELGVDESEYDEGCFADPLLPPLHRLLELSLQDGGSPGSGAEKTIEVKPGGRFKQGQVLIVAKLDRVNPLTEAKWVRTGDVDSWISQMTGRIFKPDDERRDCGWRRKISVVDPDPAPTIQHLLDTWLTTSAVGTIETRQRFIDRHVAKNVDVIIEILLRVVRTSGGSGSHHGSHPTPLIVQQAATLHAPYPEQQTQISLAVLGMYRLAIETAIEGGVGVEKVVKKATDIVRSLPYRLAFGALDGMFKDEN